MEEDYLVRLDPASGKFIARCISRVPTGSDFVVDGDFLAHIKRTQPNLGSKGIFVKWESPSQDV